MLLSAKWFFVSYVGLLKQNTGKQQDKPLMHGWFPMPLQSQRTTVVVHVTCYHRPRRSVAQQLQHKTVRQGVDRVQQHQLGKYISTKFI